MTMKKFILYCFGILLPVGFLSASEVWHIYLPKKSDYYFGTISRVDGDKNCDVTTSETEKYYVAKFDCTAVLTDASSKIAIENDTNNEAYTLLIKDPEVGPGIAELWSVNDDSVNVGCKESGDCDNNSKMNSSPNDNSENPKTLYLTL